MHSLILFINCYKFPVAALRGIISAVRKVLTSSVSGVLASVLFDKQTNVKHHFLFLVLLRLLTWLNRLGVIESPGETLKERVEVEAVTDIDAGAIVVMDLQTWWWKKLKGYLTFHYEIIVKTLHQRCR